MAVDCDDGNYHHGVILVTNNSDRPIYVVPKGIQTPGLVYKEVEEYSRSIEPGAYGAVTLALPGTRTIEHALKMFGQITLFFVDAEKFDLLPKDAPVPSDLILDSRAYRQNDLEVTDFHIHFPLD